MHWIAASLVSALFLGCYELFTKHAVRDNAVLPVLFLSTVCGAGIWQMLLLGQALHPGCLPAALAIGPLTLGQHLKLVLKALIVGLSWTATYFAVKHLSVSLSSPVRATGPIWTLIGALTLLAERPSAWQLAGIALTLASFVGLSLAGRSEGVKFHRDRWIGWLLVGTVLNSASALYDRYLFSQPGFTPANVQAWYYLYLAALFLPLAWGWKRRWWSRHEFHWRWSVALLAFALLLADFCYFRALRDPAALISIVACLRRGSTLVAFAGGLLWFGESNGRRKLPAVLGILAGIIVTALG